MIKLTQATQVARSRKGVFDWIARLQFWGDPLRCFSMKCARNRVTYFGVTGLVAAVVAIPFSAAVTGENTELAANVNIGKSPLPEKHRTASDVALFMHYKLMQVMVSNSGAPVIRFVECRHYAKEHKKLVQVGMTSDGHPILRLMPGNHCLFTSAPLASGRAAPVDLGSDSRRAENQARARVSDEANSGTNGINGRLTSYQQYACEKFGPACRIALAIQAAENSRGACEVYHYNSSDGTLDWGYFQINTVHLTRPGLNLRDLLDCKTNIDFAYNLFREKGFEPWTAYTSGAYRKFLTRHDTGPSLAEAAERLTILGPMLRSE
jgi:hypothetical protein